MIKSFIYRKSEKILSPQEKIHKNTYITEVRINTTAYSLVRRDRKNL